MEQIIREHGLWPEAGLPAQCHEFKCPPDHTNCCCWRILYLQPDFIAQKSQLAELVEPHGHICDFYPKYHCELNFIEQYWGAAKTHYHEAPRAKTAHEMENTVKDSLNKVPMIHMWRCFCHFLLYFPISPSHRFANWAARFVAVYRNRLSGAQAAWANKKYHRHRTLPPQGILKAKDAVSV